MLPTIILFYSGNKKESKRERLSLYIYIYIYIYIYTHTHTQTVDLKKTIEQNSQKTNYLYFQLKT